MVYTDKNSKKVKNVRRYAHNYKKAEDFLFGLLLYSVILRSNVQIPAHIRHYRISVND